MELSVTSGKRHTRVRGFALNHCACTPETTCGWSGRCVVDTTPCSPADETDRPFARERYCGSAWHTPTSYLSSELLPNPPSSFRNGCLTGILWNISSGTRTQIDSVSYASFLLRWITHSLPPQLSDTAEGVRGLHSHKVIHGNLKSVRKSREALPPHFDRLRRTSSLTVTVGRVSPTLAFWPLQGMQRPPYRVEGPCDGPRRSSWNGKEQHPPRNQTPMRLRWSCLRYEPVMTPLSAIPLINTRCSLGPFHSPIAHLPL